MVLNSLVPIPGRGNLFFLNHYYWNWFLLIFSFGDLQVSFLPLVFFNLLISQNLFQEDIFKVKGKTWNMVNPFSIHSLTVYWVYYLWTFILKCNSICRSWIGNESLNTFSIVLLLLSFAFSIKKVFITFLGVPVGKMRYLNLVPVVLEKSYLEFIPLRLRGFT